MNDSRSWDPSLVKKFSYSNHFKLLNQLRNEVKKYPLNNKKNSTTDQSLDPNQDKKRNSNIEDSRDETFHAKSSHNIDLNNNKSNISFNNSKNFSIYNQATYKNQSRQDESQSTEKSKTGDDSSFPSFKERLNQIDMK